MPRLLHRLVPLGPALILIALVSGCQPSAPSQSADPDSPVTPNAVAGDAIEVTALEDAPPADGAPAMGEAAGVDPTAAEALAPAETESPAAAAVPDEPAEVTPDPAPKPGPAPAAPVGVKSEVELDCDRRGGLWSAVGSGDLRACVFETKDAGKSCQRESQCEGMCLARSGTCAPFDPLFGCNDILQDDGRRVTLCIE